MDQLPSNKASTKYPAQMERIFPQRSLSEGNNKGTRVAPRSEAGVLRVTLSFR